jgi:hypothetical protein
MYALLMLGTLPSYSLKTPFRTVSKKSSRKLRWLFGSQWAVVYGPLPSVVYVVLLGVT